ncbi:MAG: hypothetical protein IJ575_00675 [Selenomonadaceae bacterium]|nr:hypothetical protein [Selenomonadaceae bacterium]
MDNTLKKLTRDNIRTAINDYFKYTKATTILSDISDGFVDCLADDAIKSKQDLRELFRKSAGWDENLQSIVINGTKTHDPDYELAYDLANSILWRARYESNYEKRNLIERAICFFVKPNDNPEEYIAAIKELAPSAYAPRKKRSRIFKALCDSLNVTDDSAGSEFQHLFAQFADELSSRKIDFKLFMSINPAHFLTMSNPKEDKRGSMMTSCHSFNSTEYNYNCGCTGYARDKVTFIVFTASDPNNPETLNNRKTTRQLFMYQPDNGLLLQSRLYNTQGGTRGAQTESKIYRDLVQRELSELEGVPNLWKTEKYCGNDQLVSIKPSYSFGGYSDWLYSDFDAKISIRADHSDDFETFTVGDYGLCISCGCEISEGLYCVDCDPDRHELCQECEEYCYETTEVINRNGEHIRVCERCLDEYYSFCEHCEHYYPKSQEFHSRAWRNSNHARGAS